MLYKVFNSTVVNFRKMYQGEGKKWVTDQNIAFVERKKTVGQAEKYFGNLVRSYV